VCPSGWRALPLGPEFGKSVTQLRSHSPCSGLLGTWMLTALLVSACAVAPDQRHYAGGVVMVAPPPPRAEVITDPPVPGDVWLSGYWAWVGNRHEWVAGQWQAPRPGRRWVPYTWVRQGDGWVLRPGHWERKRD
jgi:hypothetical protein